MKTSSHLTSLTQTRNQTEFLKELHFCFKYHLMFESESVSHSVMPDSATLWTTAHQAPLSTEFSRQEYWSGQPFPSPENLPYPGAEPGSPALQADSLPLSPDECLLYNNCLIFPLYQYLILYKNLFLQPKSLFQILKFREIKVLIFKNMYLCNIQH